MRQDVTTLRLYLLRGLYLLVFVYLSTSIWPLLIHHRPWDDLMHGVAVSLLAALGVLMALGIRYPLRMLPVMLFELLWKAVWVAAIGLPLWRAGKLDGDAAETFKSCFLGVVLVPLIIPWRYFWETYVKAPADRWGRSSATSSSAMAARREPDVPSPKR
jgi:hypothetical protein